MTGKRGVYRVRQDRPFLRATLAVPGSPPLKGHVLDLSSRGAGLLMEGGVPEVPSGTECELRLESLVLLQPFLAKVRVRQWIDGPDQVRVGVQFVDSANIERQVPYVLRHEFNRRTSPRAPVAEPLMVEVRPTDGDASTSVRILDISTGGMRVQGSMPEADRIAKWGRVRLAFRLPDFLQPLCLTAEVRTRSGLEVSLAFAADLEEERPDVHDALADFVLAHLPAARSRKP